jgi:hypothetical protein
MGKQAVRHANSGKQAVRRANSGKTSSAPRKQWENKQCADTVV